VERGASIKPTFLSEGGKGKSTVSRSLPRRTKKSGIKKVKIEAEETMRLIVLLETLIKGREELRSEIDGVLKEIQRGSRKVSIRAEKGGSRWTLEEGSTVLLPQLRTTQLMENTPL